MVIDRFEGRFAVCEIPSGATFDVPRELLPEDAREGDVVVVWADGRLTVDVGATESRRSRVRSLHDRLFGRQSTGPAGSRPLSAGPCIGEG